MIPEAPMRLPGEVAAAECHCNRHLAARPEDEGLRREEPVRHRAAIPITEQASAIVGALLGAKGPLRAQPAAAGEEGEGGGLTGLVQLLTLPRRAAE